MFEFNNFTVEEYRQRLQILQRLCAEKEIDLVVLNSGVDLYYYAGSVLPLYLFVPITHEPFLLARKAADQIRTEVSHIKLEEFGGSKDLIRIFDSCGLKPGKIGFTFEATSFATTTRLLSFFESAHPVDITLDLKLLRVRKSPAEITIQEEAGKILAGFPQVVRLNFKPGMSELAVSQHIETYFRLHGNEIISTKQEGLSLAYGVCACGPNSLTGNKFDGICAGRGVSRSMPFGAGRTVIADHVPIIMDYAFVLNGYHMDMTRMASLGEPAKEVLAAYNAMLTIEEAIIKALRPGKTGEEIYNLAERLAAELGYADKFMTAGRDRTRFVGHGVGLQLDEPPYLAPKMERTLESNMTIAVEPKVALPGIGVVGIEDTFLVTETAARCLTECSREWLIL